MPLHLVATDRPIRPSPAGCDQQGRHKTRPAYAWPARRATLSGGHGTEQWPDTIATGPGSADPLGDDQAERHSGWGMFSDSAAPEGGKHREPSKTARDDTPSAGWVVLIGVLCVAAVGACALIAQHLPRVPTT